MANHRYGNISPQKVDHKASSRHSPTTSSFSLVLSFATESMPASEIFPPFDRGHLLPSLILIASNLTTHNCRGNTLSKSSNPHPISLSMAIPPGSRIPAGLQAIFMASNQGQDVHEPPKDGSAFRVFRRGGVLKRNRSRSFTRHPFFQGIRSMFGKVRLRHSSLTCQVARLKAMPHSSRLSF